MDTEQGWEQHQPSRNGMDDYKQGEETRGEGAHTDPPQETLD